MAGRCRNSKPLAQGAFSGIIKKEPIAHPQNCKEECPYGYNRAFCFPCIEKILEETRNKKKMQQKEIKG